MVAQKQDGNNRRNNCQVCGQPDTIGILHEVNGEKVCMGNMGICTLFAKSGTFSYRNGEVE